MRAILIWEGGVDEAEVDQAEDVLHRTVGGVERVFRLKIGPWSNMVKDEISATYADETLTDEQTSERFNSWLVLNPERLLPR